MSHISTWRVLERVNKSAFIVRNHVIHLTDWQQMRFKTRRISFLPPPQVRKQQGDDSAVKEIWQKGLKRAGVREYAWGLVDRHQRATLCSNEVGGAILLYFGPKFYPVLYTALPTGRQWVPWRGHDDCSSAPTAVRSVRLFGRSAGRSFGHGLKYDVDTSFWIINEYT